jgi:tetratricopeptide (TPR) repeat protein
MTSEWPDFNDLWDMDDPAGTQVKFRALLSEAKTSGETSYYLQLLTQIARTLGLQKKFDEANLLLDEVEQEMQGDNIVAVRTLLERGRVLNTCGQPEQAVPLFEKAYEIANRIGADYYAADALHMLGIASPAEELLDWNLKAITYVERSTQKRARYWLGPLYNNIGWTYFEQGQLEQAIEAFQKAQFVREQQGKPKEIHIARWCVARALREMGKVEAALEIQRKLEVEGMEDGFVYEEIGECLYALGESQEAAFYFQKAYELLSEIEWVAMDTKRMERLKALGA